MKKKVLLKGPLLTRSGYGEQTMFALRALKSREDLFDIYIQPITWGSCSWIIDDTEDRKWIDKTIEKTIHYIQGGGKFGFCVLGPEGIGYGIPSNAEQVLAFDLEVQTSKVGSTFRGDQNLGPTLWGLMASCTAFL